MKLAFEQIKSVTKGASRVYEVDGSVSFSRFTKEQSEFYKNNSRSLSSSSIKLEFTTDSEALYLCVNTECSASRTYFSYDVYVNDNYLASIDNFSHLELPHNYNLPDYKLGRHSKSFELGKGDKKVTVYFPWSVSTEISEMSLDDGSYIKPTKQLPKMIAFGDSITQGYDVLRPSKHPINMLASKLGYEVYNKAIGGEVFCPELALKNDEFEPEIITVAYGTNDWSHLSYKDFSDNCTLFYNNLRKTYPDAKIFAITPIWRRDENESKECGAFSVIEKTIREVASSINNTYVICGYDFIPHNEKYFMDYYLHPNDSGFEYYFDNLYNEIIKNI